MSEQAWQEATTYLDLIKRIKTEIKPQVGRQPQMIKALFSSKMVITQKVGQLTRSQTKVIAIAKALDKNIVDAASVGQEFQLYIMDLTAKQILKQAEKEVAVKRNMAFPLAVVCVLLFNKHAQFLDVLLGRFMKRCPYTIPCFYNKASNETNREYQKRLAYREVDEGVLETEIQYGERMCGLIALYSAIMQTTVSNLV